MYTTIKVSSSQALQLVQYVVDTVTKYKRPVAVAVCGPEGELIAFLRMDGTSPAASRIAQNKAYTAAIDCTPTMKMGERMRGRDNHAFWGDDRVTGFGGGIPVFYNNVVIGGVGISGLPEADDHQVAEEAIKAIFGTE